MNQFDSITSKWNEKINQAQPGRGNDALLLKSLIGIVGVLVVVLLFGVEFAFSIYEYAAQQQLPVTTVLLRLGKMDLLITEMLAIFVLVYLVVRTYNRYVFTLKQTLSIAIFTFLVVGAVGSIFPGVRATYQATIAPLKTPLGFYFIAQAQTDMKRAKVDMGVITAIVPLGKNSYRVTLQTDVGQETYLMDAEAIPPLQTPIWVAYTSVQTTKKMSKMGILPVSPR